VVRSWSADSSSTVAAADQPSAAREATAVRDSSTSGIGSPEPEGGPGPRRASPLDPEVARAYQAAVRPEPRHARSPRPRRLRHRETSRRRGHRDAKRRPSSVRSLLTFIPTTRAGGSRPSTPPSRTPTRPTRSSTTPERRPATACRCRTRSRSSRVPRVEVRLSNPQARQGFHHTSVIAGVRASSVESRHG
jgi:hypothetical protein